MDSECDTRQAGSKKNQYEDKHKDKYKDKCKNNRHAYDIICFWKGDDNRSLIMKNVQNMQNMQNMQNISSLFFSSKDQKSKIPESESSINSRTCLGHLVLFQYLCYF